MLFQDMLFHEHVGYNAIFEVFVLLEWNSSEGEFS